MIREIVRDEAFLRQRSEPATAADLQVAGDLIDTLAVNAARCMGLSANMIGVQKRIIVADDGGTPIVLFHPEITKAGEPFQTEEARLSLDGTRPTKRYKSIKVRYQNSDFVLIADYCVSYVSFHNTICDS